MTSETHPTPTTPRTAPPAPRTATAGAAGTATATTTATATATATAAASRTAARPATPAGAGPGPGSGPGRAAGSDSRFRSRRIRTRRRRHLPVDHEALRRRAEALLTGSPTPAAPPVPAAPPLPVDEPFRTRPVYAGPASAGRTPPGPTPPEPAPAGLSPGAARRLAVRERLPLWLQARCGPTPRSLAAVTVVLVAGLGFAAQQYWSARPEPVTATLTAPVPVADRTPMSSASVGPRVVVDVGGKVRAPGVLRLPAGSRVADALAAAGGVRPGTDTTGLNRARILIDGEHVLVGTPVPSGAPAALPPAAQGGPAPGGPLSLGTATVEQLDGLPGVGPVLARHIVDFRTVRGGFRSVEDLRQVNGIGERRFADLRTLVRP